MNKREEEEEAVTKEELALAKVGIIALIDEATGYQKQRFQQPGKPLQEMFEELREQGE